MSKPKGVKHYWGCHACTTKLGGVMEEDFVGTAVLQQCPYCGGADQLPSEGLFPWVDYNWPEQGSADATAKANRD